MNKSKQRILQTLREIAGSLCAGTIFGLVMTKTIPVYNIIFPALFLVPLIITGYFLIKDIKRFEGDK